MQQSPLQRRSLQAYLSLFAHYDLWQHRFAALAAGDAERAFAYAAVAAGACVLWMDGRSEALRSAQQEGLTDFQVDSLSEALRILKNEVRKGLPVCVGLAVEPADAWAEMVLRGVQPDALFAVAPCTDVLLQRGAARLVPGENTDLECDIADGWRSRKSQDAALLERIGEASSAHAIAARWITASAGLFPRDLSRWWSSTWLHSVSEDGREGL